MKKCVCIITTKIIIIIIIFFCQVKNMSLIA